MPDIIFNLNQSSLPADSSVVRADSVEELRARFAEILHKAGDSGSNPTVVYSNSSDSEMAVTDAGVFYREEFDHSHIMHPFAQAVFDQNFDRTSGDLWREAAIPILLADLHGDNEINGYFNLQQYAQVLNEIEPSNDMSAIVFEGQKPEGVMSEGFQKRVNQIVEFLFADTPVSVLPSPSVLDLFDILSSLDPGPVQKIEGQKSVYTIRNSELLLQQIYKNPTTMQRLIATVEQEAQSLRSNQLVGDVEFDPAVQAALGKPNEVADKLLSLSDRLQAEFDVRYPNYKPNVNQ